MNSSVKLPTTNRARLFLSCGQNPEYGEPEIARSISQALEALGFRVFCSIDTQCTKSATEVIFNELRESDYYLFIDFKREQLCCRGNKKKPKYFRGSLFTHQELGLACFLNMEILPFRENGVEPLSGLIGAVLANATEFTDRDNLPHQVEATVKGKINSGEWSTTTQNRLSLEAAHDSGDVDIQTDPMANTSRRLSHYHINVDNLHFRKPATNCYAYVENIVNQETGQRIGPKFTCELKWEGTKLQGIRIGPNSSRGLDAFIIEHLNSGEKKLVFEPVTDAANHCVTVKEPANLIVTYVVCSQEFAEARQQFRINFNGSDITISPNES